MSTPPALTPPSVLVKAKRTYTLWLAAFNDFPKVHRGSLGRKVDDSFLDMLEAMFAALYLPAEQKMVGIGTTIAKLDGVKFLMQLAWENKCVSSERYATLSEGLDEIGRMLGGWRKGLEKKTPARAGRTS
jgi:hypothetical protein